MSKKDKAPKVKKDKATKKAEKAEKKLARKAQRIEDKKNPEIKAANKATIIKCIGAIVCAVIFFFNISSAFETLAEAIVFIFSAAIVFTLAIVLMAGL